MQTQAVLARITLTQASPPPACNVGTSPPDVKPPIPASKETLACLAMSAVAAHVRGDLGALDELLESPELRAEVAGLLRRVADGLEDRL